MSTVEPYASPNAVTYEGRDFTEDEARRLTADIKAWAGTLWVRLEAAHRGKAWKALGYTSWGDYLESEFDIRRSRGYQLVSHAAAVRELTEAAGVDVSTAVDIPERHTRAIDTQAAAADIAAAVEAEPDADEGRRVEIVEETVEKHRTSTIVDGNGEIIEGPSSDAPVPPGAVEPDDDAPEDSAVLDGAPEGSGDRHPDPSPNEPAPPSPALQRAQLAEQASKAAHAVRSKLLPLDPADIAAVCPADEWTAYLDLAVDLRRWCDRVDAAFSPNLRSVQ